MTNVKVLEITPERNHELRELAVRIVEIMSKEATPFESYYVLDILIKSLKQAENFEHIESMAGPLQ